MRPRISSIASAIQLPGVGPDAWSTPMPRAGRAGVPAHLPPTELANTQVAQADPRRLTADGVELAARTPQQLCLKFVLTDNERLMAMVCNKCAGPSFTVPTAFRASLDCPAGVCIFLSSASCIWMMTYNTASRGTASSIQWLQLPTFTCTLCITRL